METFRICVGNRVVETKIINTQSKLDDCLNLLLSSMGEDSGMKCVVGLDIEKECSNVETSSRVIDRVAVVKLCYGTTVLIIQLCNITGPPRLLSKFLQLREISFVSVGMKDCQDSLEKDYGIRCRNAVDLGHLAATVRGNEAYRAYGLLDLAKKECLTTVKVKGLPSIYHGCEVLRSWGGAKLSHNQVELATWTAFLCFCTGNSLLGGYLSSDSIGTIGDDDYKTYDQDYLLASYA